MNHNGNIVCEMGYTSKNMLLWDANGLWPLNIWAACPLTEMRFSGSDRDTHK